MARAIFYLAILISSTVFGQRNEKEAVKATVNTFFEGFHKGDTTLMRSVLADKVVLQTAFKNKDGKAVLRNDGDVSKLLHAIATRSKDQKWDERLLDYSIQIDGNMANAWTPYEFWLNDAFLHCGVNSFQLFKDGENWKIIYLIDTRRKKGCQEG